MTKPGPKPRKTPKGKRWCSRCEIFHLVKMFTGYQRWCKRAFREYNEERGRK